ncbi:MAG: hypothetical protein HQL73_12905 [Magnetococcales bacterium]|nr:hypothetical protein [Magnetococcales bacterium]
MHVGAYASVLSALRHTPGWGPPEVQPANNHSEKLNQLGTTNNNSFEQLLGQMERRWDKQFNGSHS